MKKFMTFFMMLVLFLGSLVVIGYNVHIDNVQAQVRENIPSEIPDSLKTLSFDVNKDSEVVKDIVYDGLTLDELANKLNRSLNSTLSGKGMVFATKSLKYGVDPYLAVAISLHETGCKWTCSYLVRACNNIGGVKGKPSCNGGSYKAYSTIDEGIDHFIKNLGKNYVAKGLDTAVLMQKKYTGTNSSTWAVKVNNYISSIKEA